MESLSVDNTFQTIFAKGAGHSLKLQANMGYDIIGIDWTVDPEKARLDVGPNITLQGNLDPQDLYKPQVNYGECINFIRIVLTHR